MYTNIKTTSTVHSQTQPICDGTKAGASYQDRHPHLTSTTATAVPKNKTRPPLSPSSIQLLSKYATNSPTGARGLPDTTLGGGGTALARASSSSRRISSGSRNPDDVEDHGVRGSSSIASGTADIVIARSVLCARERRRSGFVRAAATAMPAPATAALPPPLVCARGRRGGERRGAESALVSVSSPLASAMPSPSPFRRCCCR